MLGGGARSAPFAHMPLGHRHLFIAGLLLACTASLAVTGILERGWSRLNPLRAWQADQVAAASAGNAGEGAEERLREQVVRLNAENAELRRRLAEYEEVVREGGLHPRSIVLQRAAIVARDQRRGHRFVEIDAGAVDGVVDGMAVAIGWSLVGVVAGERAGGSLVRLVTDVDSRIPANLCAPGDGDAPGRGEIVALGVLAGTGDRERCELRFVEERPDLQVVPGMAVISAGGPGPVPPGMVLGVVRSAAQEPHTDHWAIEVEPLRDTGLHSTVLVLRAPMPAR